MGRPLNSIEGRWAGRVVYPFGRPGRLGRVVKKGKKQSLVWWAGWEEPGLEDNNGLQDFESLVLDTEKLARNHRARLEEMLKERY